MKMKGKFQEEQNIIDMAIAEKDKIPIEVHRYLSHFICNNLIPIMHRDMLDKKVVDDAVTNILDTMSTIGICVKNKL